MRLSINIGVLLVKDGSNLVDLDANICNECAIIMNWHHRGREKSV
jgi:hypothetical protein